MENGTNEKEIHLDLREVMSYTLRKWWIVLICFVVGLAIGFTWGTLTRKETYSTHATFVVYYDGGSSLVDQANEQAKVSSILGGCVTFVKQNRFAKAVTEELNKSDKYNLSPETIQKSVEYSYSTEDGKNIQGNYIFATAKAPTSEMSYDIMVVVTDIFEDYIKTNYHMAGDASIVFSLANDLEVPLTPTANVSVPTFTVVGGVVSALICVIVFVVIVNVDQRVKGEEDLVNRYNIPVIGSVPNFEDKDLFDGGYYYEQNKD